MKKIFKRSISLLLSLIVLMTGINIVANAVGDSDTIEKLVSVAKNEIGYLEETYDDGSFYSKYGDWYGLPNGSWCAMFVSWCANKAGISTSVIPKFASCSVGRTQLQNMQVWKDSGEYTPKKGDLIFLNNCTHVGIVESFDDDIITTIEGNAADANGQNFGVRERRYAITSSKITGYAAPKYELTNDFNGVGKQKSTAYMLPDSTSKTVWEIWANDELDVICEDGNYYLVMYPFLSTGKYVCAYVEKGAVTLNGNVPNASEFYLNKIAKTKKNVTMYHNPSDESLMSNSGVDKKIRGNIESDTNVQILFERNDYYFVKYNDITGFVRRDDLDVIENTTSSSNIKIGDVNNDGKISVMDATAIQKHTAKLIVLDEQQCIAADVDFDKKVSVKDATLIQKYITDIIVEFPSPTIPEETSTAPTNTTTEPTTSAISTSPNVDVTAINVSGPENIYLGDSEKINYTVLPDNATNKTVYWISSDDAIVSVDSDGTLHAKSLGKVRIDGINPNGIRTSFYINVIKKTIEPEKIVIDNRNPKVINTGDTLQLNATVSPADTTDKSVSWYSSNEDVAVVDANGLVTAKNAGVATITASTINTNIYSTSTVRVNKTTTYLESGTYCLKLKGTNSYLDHQGGTSNGVNVHLWSGDGNSNGNQKINLERIDDNRYKLWSSCSTDLLIDVNRGSSYSDPIEVGKNIDIWKNNDWQAQEWLFTKTYDGYYILRLNMYQGGAIEASGKGNGDNIFFGAYNPENDMQKWELVNTSDYVVPETTAWIYNTLPVGNVHVRSGPGRSYSSIGGFNEGQKITVIGGLNGDFYKVRGANRHDGSVIEGYTHKDYVTFVKPETPVDPIQNKFNELRNRYINGQYWNKYNDPSGNKSGTIPCKCSRTCTASCSCRCGAFIYNGTEVAWQCHGYALKLGYEMFGTNPNGWHKEYNLNNVQPGDIIRYLNNGHTVMVTGVSGNTITFTDCNWSGPCKIRWDASMSKSSFTGLSYVLKHP